MAAITASVISAKPSVIDFEIKSSSVPNGGSR